MQYGHKANDSAHKAANPEAYPIREDVRAQMPSLQGIEEKHGPTDVHLQVYDGKLWFPFAPALAMEVGCLKLIHRHMPRSPPLLHDQTRSRPLSRHRDIRALRDSLGSRLGIRQPHTYAFACQFEICFATAKS